MDNKTTETLETVLVAIGMGLSAVLLVTGLVVGADRYMKYVHAHPEATVEAE